MGYLFDHAHGYGYADAISKYFFLFLKCYLFILLFIYLTQTEKIHIGERTDKHMDRRKQTPKKANLHQTINLLVD